MPRRIKVDGIQMMVPQFQEMDEMYMFDYGSGKNGSGKMCHFEAAMISTCKPLFDDCESNYEVEEKLRAAKVVLPQSMADSESCALVVHFRSVKSANAFIGRLNKYLIEKARRLEAARRF